MVALARRYPGAAVTSVDLVIRTSGEWRLSNFMLWRTAHAIFFSTPILWPDFQREHLQEAIRNYAKQISEQYSDA